MNDLRNSVKPIVFKPFAILGMLLALVMVFSMFSAVKPAEAATYKNVPADVNLLLKKINDLRVSKGLNKVRINTDISNVALDWSTKMADTGKFEHNYGWVWDKRVPKQWRFGGEIIATNFGSVDMLYTQWLNSPTHYKYMTADYFNTVGIGLAVGKGGLYGTVDFAQYDKFPPNTYTSYPTPTVKPKIVTKGAIGAYYKKYSKLTGVPTANEKVLKNPNGYSQTFKNGVVYYSSKSGAHLNKGKIRTAYKTAKYEKGKLGFPTTDEKVFKYNKKASYQSFQKGIVVSHSKGAYSMNGSIFSKWKSLGWERGKLGLPIGNEYKSGSGTKQKFQKGYMTWTKKSGVKTYKK